MMKNKKFRIFGITVVVVGWQLVSTTGILWPEVIIIRMFL